MVHLSLSESDLRALLKQALAEALDERRDLLHDVLTEVLEDIGLAEAIREGRDTERVSRDAVFAALDETP
ncbi:MAG: hypothetical protein AAFY55_11465 [Bacteroidota bacterium]